MKGDSLSVKPKKRERETIYDYKCKMENSIFGK